MYIDFLLKVFKQYQNNEAVVFRDKKYNYNWLLEKIESWKEYLDHNDIHSGRIIILEADFSPNSVALLLALITKNCIVVPLTASVERKKSEFIEIAQGDISLAVRDSNDQAQLKTYSFYSQHKLYEILRVKKHAGLVLFSSGSTGKSKATVHDFSRLLEKYKTPRYNYRTLAFLFFDHIGGIDTLFYSLSNASCIITVNDRSPENICGIIEKHIVEVLPASPSFLNLLLLSQAYKNYDLSSLKYITYGAEVMPESTLKQCTKIFSNVNILQKYGTTEVGTLRSHSKSSDSLWVKIGGEGYQTRVVDGILQIKANSSMLGYLNAPDPFTEDGWFITGDRVEVDGEYIKFLGRESDIINVGSEKVYPAEVENVIMQFENINDVTVFSEKNPLIGNIVCAKISVKENIEKEDFIRRLKKYCNERLQNYKVPVKILIINDVHHTSRYKKIRTTKEQLKTS